MLRRILPFAALLAAALAPAAHAETQTASQGPITATLSYTPDPDGVKATGLSFTILRNGAPALTSGLTGGSCESPYCKPAGIDDDPSVHVADIGGTAEPEVFVDLYTGGAHCCTLTRFFRWDGTRYVGFSHNFADPGYRLQDLDGDGRPELRSADAAFGYEFTSFAGAGFPLQVWSFDGTKLRDVTKKHPRYLRADRDKQYKNFRRALKDRQYGEPRGPIAAWAADRYLLGERTSTLKSLRRMARRGELRPGQIGTPKSGAAFVRSLDRFLRKSGY